MAGRKCHPCNETHPRLDNGTLVLRRYQKDRRSGESLRQMEQAIRSYAENHPELRVGFDGDEYAILGWPQKHHGARPS